jgi:hypothetical protein
VIGNGNENSCPFFVSVRGFKFSQRCIGTLRTSEIIAPREWAICAGRFGTAW